MNKVYLTGRLIKDVILSYTRNQEHVYLKNTLAIPRHGKSEEVDYINITAFAENAKMIHIWCEKGSKLSVIGTLQINSNKAEDGSWSNYTNVNIQDISFMESKATKIAKKESKEKGD